MTNQEIEEEAKTLLMNQDVFTVNNVLDVNHKPHPYTVGAQHVTHAAKHHNGMLGEATLKAVGCAHPDCTTSYEDHTSDKVLFLSLLRDVRQEEARDILTRVIVAGGGTLKGVAFVETPEQYRIKNDEDVSV